MVSEDDSEVKILARRRQGRGGMVVGALGRDLMVLGMEWGMDRSWEGTSRDGVFSWSTLWGQSCIVRGHNVMENGPIGGRDTDIHVRRT